MILPAPIACGLAAGAGTVIGSFMSVVAARVPPLVRESVGGRVHMAALLKTLSWPGSHCSHCRKALRWRDNVPVLSFLLLGGRCHACHARYGARYILLELATGAAAALSLGLFGWTVQAAMIFALLAVLLALGAIDFAEMLLPDILVLPLVPLGLVYQLRYGGGVVSGVSGAACAFALLWLIGTVYRRGRGRDGLGGGDVKLAGALGMWLGLGAVPVFLLGAFTTGLVGMGLPILLSHKRADAAVPFGPFLALSAAALLLFPQSIDRLQALMA